MFISTVKTYAAPAIEPVTLSEVKAHLRVDHTDEDTLIGALIPAARQLAEQYSRRAFITRTLDAVLDCWPGDDEISLPYPPLIGITSITYTDTDGNPGTMASGDYYVDAVSQPGRVILADGAAWPDATLRTRAGITVRYTAGYGAAADVPQIYKAAILLLIGHLFENREAVTVGAGLTATPLPLAVEALLMTDRGSLF
jgi:uncharacterized phiE125 gp8 family phage protein